MGELLLVTGGARSGKSRFAERLAAASGRPVTYVATMEALDDEVRARIARHRAERPAVWTTVEAPIAIVEAVRGAGLQLPALLRQCFIWLCFIAWPTSSCTANPTSRISSGLITHAPARCHPAPWDSAGEIATRA